MQHKNVVKLAVLVLVSSSSVFASDTAKGWLNKSVAFVAKPADNAYVKAAAVAISVYMLAKEVVAPAYKAVVNRFPVTKPQKEAAARAAADAQEKAKQATLAEVHASLINAKNPEYASLVQAEDEAKKARIAKLGESAGLNKQ